MSVFYNNDITNKGRQLFALMQDGGKFMPTRIVMGSGYMPQGTTTRTINDVVIPFATLEINKSSPKENGDFMLGGLFTNSDLTQDEYFRELGLYAKVQKSDGSMTEEVLYSYGNAFDNAELIPKYGVDTAIERQLDIITYVGNDANVVVEVTSGISVDKQEFDEEIDRLDGLIDGKVDKVTGKGLSSNDFDDAYKAKLDGLESELGKYETKSTMIAATISASGWSNGQYSFEDSYPNATYDLSVEPDSTCTEAQLDAWSGARIVGSSTGNVLKAFGDVPAVDIPVILGVKKK